MGETLRCELRAAVDELVEAEQLRREADSLEAAAIAYLAEHYVVTGHEPVDAPLDDEFGFLAADGTPPISDFLSLEVAAVKGITTMAASELISTIVNLKYRHPRTWDDVVSLRVPLWIASRAVSECRKLPHAVAVQVDARWATRHPGLPTARKFRLLRGLVAAADPTLVAQKAREALADRHVVVGTNEDTTMWLGGRLNTIDALQLDAQLDQIADILTEQGATQPKRVLRATALGILATPARALNLLQSAIQPDLLSHDTPGHLCGAVGVDPEKLLPRAQIVLHVGATPDGELGPVVRTDRVAHLPLTALADLLTDVRVTVRPVIDLNETPAVDRYEIPEQLRLAATTRHPYDMFPFSGRSTRGLDLDHTTPWQPAGAPDQTSLNNLAPLNRRAHRAKTARTWTLTRGPNTNELIWESPLGFTYTVDENGTHRTDPLTPHELVLAHQRQTLLDHWHTA